MGPPRDIWLLPTDGTREPVVFLETPSDETPAMFSPDGRWIAYVSDESGRREVYVRPFPGPGERTQISVNGASEPMWARNGRELFYREGNRLMTVTVEAGSTFVASAPQALFEGRFVQVDFGLGASTANYDVSQDGRRFLMVRRKNPVTPTVVHVVVNWLEGLNGRDSGRNQ